MVTKSVTLSEKRKGLSKRESYLLSYLSEKNKDIFKLKDVMKILGCSYPNAKVTAERLIKKKWIERLLKGRYMIIPFSAGIEGKYLEHEFIIASLFSGYIGYWTALNYYGFTEQIPDKIFIASRKRLKDRTILGIRLKFISIDEKKFFGFKKIKILNHSIKISNPEKTIIDCLDKPKYCGGIGEIIKALEYGKEEINFKKLRRYALQIRNNSVIKRLGFILEYLNLNTMEFEKLVGKGYSILDPTKEKKRKYDSKWKLLVNIKYA